ncbi:HAD-like domain-containing protein [Amylocarpus encephaloides]|uniref:HAD-like domain-containing protein n=1 Tax=Amylocarpus encephaloides TaxID=45428 RepID=A0A9P7YN92_9HELO|nr:HAD-like domain-containing protein [Amylocarpus encephaloides]
MDPRTDFPPIRACIFDMDGLLLDSEDKYTICVNTILERYGRPKIPWSVKAQMQGRPGPASGAIFHAWAKLPRTLAEFQNEQFALQRELFPSCGSLPGVEKLLSDLKSATIPQPGSPERANVHVALATSSHSANFKLKTDHLKSLFSIFPQERRVLGDDERIPEGRGKPAPDIYFLALKTINESLPESESEVKPEECLVFEDSVLGVESGRRARMRVVWVPHPELKGEYAGREGEVLAGATGGSGCDEHQVGKVGDGWGVELGSLEDFDWERYGISIDDSKAEKLLLSFNAIN